MTFGPIVGTLAAMATTTATVIFSAKNAAGPGAAAASKAIEGVGKAAKSASKETASAMAGIGKSIAGVAAGFATLEVAKKVLEVGMRALGASIAEAMKGDAVGPFKAKLEDLTQSWRNNLRAVGDIITQSPAVQAAMDGVKGILDRVTGSIRGNSTQAQNLAQSMIKDVLGAFEGVIRGGGFLLQMFDGLRVAWQLIQVGLVEGATLYIKGWAKIGDAVVGVMNLFRDADNQMSNPLDAAVAAMEQLRIGARETLDDGIERFERHRKTVDMAADAIHGLRNAVADATPGQIKFGEVVADTTKEIDKQKESTDDDAGAIVTWAKGVDVLADILLRYKNNLMDANTEAYKVPLAYDKNGRAIYEVTQKVEGASTAWNGFGAELLDVGGIVSSVMSGIMDSIDSALAYNRQAASDMVADLRDSFEDQKDAVETSAEDVRAAREALWQAQRSGDQKAVEDARRYLDARVRDHKKALRTMRQGEDDYNDAREDASLTTNQRIGKAVGEFFKDLIKQIIQAAITKIAVDAVTAAVSAISAHAGIPYVGLIIGLAAAAAIGGAIAGISAGLPKAAEGGIVTGGQPGRDSVAAMLMPGEMIVPADTAQGLLKAARRSVGGGAVPSGYQTPPGAAQGGIVRAMSGAAASVNNYFQITIHTAATNADQLARDLAPRLRRLQAQGAF